jgi:MerR family transcriptional regulator, heat shock protein HspR
MARPPDWQRRLDDPAEPLYTLAVVSDLLGVDPQAVRRMDIQQIAPPARPSGNQRRYSRNDVTLLAHAFRLSDEGHALGAIERILALELEVERLQGGQRRTRSGG